MSLVHQEEIDAAAQDSLIAKEYLDLHPHFKVWHPCNISPSAKIGQHVNIGMFTEIGPNVVIGDRVRIGAACFIPEGVTIEDDVFIGPHVVFTNDKFPCSPKDQWQNTLVKRGARIGAGCTILPVTIGRNSMIGAGSCVTKAVPENMVWAGNPAKQLYDYDEEVKGAP